MQPEAVDVSVVIATRDRPADLARCLGALEAQDYAGRWELVVVDDGGTESLEPVLRGRRLPLRVVRTGGDGPATARNAGWREARGRVVAFTDDDTVPAPTWLSAAATLLDADASVVGIEGPTRTAPFDRLREHSVQASGPGAWLTCNIAYRRDALERVGGFFERFPSAHCEDLDLGLRMQRLGSMRYAEDMVVEHTVRPMTLRKHVLNGRLVVNETVLFRRHPDVYADALAMRPVVRAVRSRLAYWLRHMRREGPGLLRSPSRLAQWSLAAAGNTAVAAWSARRFERDPDGTLARRAG